MPPLAHDPNVAYFLLIFGLWLSVTAAYIPGTGIVELAGGAALIGALAMIAALPTNLGALLILMVGVLGFAVLPFLRVRPLWMALAGLVLQAGGSIALFNDGVSVSPLLIIVTLALPLAYHTLVLMPMLSRQRNQRPVTDRDSDLIGKKGRVIEALNPIGSVIVNNETWTAEARRKIEVGMPIIVVEREGLKLIVELDKVKRDEFLAASEDDDDEVEPTASVAGTTS